MIKTLTGITQNIWDPLTSINSTKPTNPSVGDVYYDTNKSKIYMFDGSNWKELRISGKDALNNQKRMRKIKRLFE